MTISDAIATLSLPQPPPGQLPLAAPPGPGGIGSARLARYGFLPGELHAR